MIASLLAIKIFLVNLIEFNVGSSPSIPGMEDIVKYEREFNYLDTIADKRNAIEYLKLQSIFGAENDRALPNLGKEEYGSTVNSKVSQYNDYLENYSPSMDSRLIQIYIQVANNLESPNKNSLLASN